MADHIVRAFDADLDTLSRGVAELGGLAESMTTRAIEALMRQSPAIANEVIALDARLDALQQDVEEKAILTIARRQPLAIDLRLVIAAIRITHDLERIGDLAKNISKRVIAITGLVQPKLVKGVEHLAKLVLTQLKDVLDAYVERNAEKALDVWKHDENIDAFHTSLFRELLTYMMEDPRNIGVCTHLLFCAKNIERMGDHATNVAENVYYLVTGNQLLSGRVKADATSLEKPVGAK
jgi:phosphate transport system protein